METIWYTNIIAVPTPTRPVTFFNLTSLQVYILPVSLINRLLVKISFAFVVIVNGILFVTSSNGVSGLTA